ncbi:hypothetical protein IEQ34_014522 [Dendrobium chrysotoxum]|uniref:Uncharacterized protein n=1 Tax=Dendrobium chrysotoxum TaxID=161865 RepID=A0AAV7G3F7_DENCH|nr:hypothetical protein IEQ34_014522 [Dendrobium chrysotoxum]
MTNMTHSRLGSLGRIISVDDLENIIGGHVLLGSICIFGGNWHCLSNPHSHYRVAIILAKENAHVVEIPSRRSYIVGSYPSTAMSEIGASVDKRITLR